MLLFFGGMSNGQGKQGKRQGEQQAAHKESPGTAWMWKSVM
jgi:hypothetical protein